MPPSASARSKLVRVVVVGCLLLSAVAIVVPVSAAETVSGRPDLHVLAPENTVAPGTETVVNLYLENRGELDQRGAAEFEALVQTARVTSVRVDSGDAPVTVLTGRTPVGNVPVGITEPVPFRVRVDEDVAPGAYTVEAVVRYEHTRRVRTTQNDTQFIEETVRERLEFDLVVEERARFEVVEVTSDVAVGGTGTMTLAVRNAGSEVAREATVGVTAADPAVSFESGAPTAARFVGRWEPGGVREVEYRVAVASDALVREYAATATVAYVDSAGRPVESRPLAVGLRPSAAQQFTISAVESDLGVGTSGRLSFSVRNDGDAPASDVTAVLQSSSTQIVPDEAAVPVGALAPGASAPVTFTVDVSNAAAPGPRRIPVIFEYRTGDGTLQSTDSQDVQVEVGPRSRPFAVSTVNGTFEVDSDGTLTVELTNAGSEPVRDVTADLVTAEPMSSDDPRAFVSELAPGETTQLRFHLAVSDEAIPKTGAVAVALAYTDAAGTVQQTEPYSVPVTVVESEAPPLPVAPLALVVVAIVAAAAWWWRRR